MKRRERSSALFRIAGLLSLALCLATAAVAEEEPFKVQWPEGWKIERRPGPIRDGDKRLGEKIRATSQDGQATLELTYVPRPAGSNPSFGEELDAMAASMRKAFESRGMKATVAPRQATDLSGHPGFATEISAANETNAVRLWFAMAKSSSHLYSLSFMGMGDAFERHRGAFEATRRSLVLQ